MSVSVKFHCNGCDAAAEGKSRIRQHFEPLYGNRGGLCRIVVETIDSVCPDGWIAFDLVGATYCPKCAAEIWPDEAPAAAEDRQ